MKKIYISPATDIVEINLRYSILDMSVTNVGNETTLSSDVDSEGSGTPDEGSEDYSRTGGNSSVWDNLW